MNFKDKIQEILENRQKEYGDAKTSFSNIARRLTHLLGIPITPEQAIKCMIEVKRARLDYNPTHEDSLIDIICYEILLCELNMRELNKPDSSIPLKTSQALDS